MPPRPRFDRRAPVRELPNINDRINYPNLRVVDADGSQLGVITREEALDVARDRELDLVLVSEKADPPVCQWVKRLGRTCTSSSPTPDEP